ncbi:MAG: hypothetical protein RLZZ555_2221 [Pseudomonadota bacterium]
MNTKTLPGFSSPSASTEVPLEMLAACHGRVEQQCLTLQRLGAHLISQGCDEQARQAARTVMRYFDTAAQDHHADEEQDLFPALLSSPSAAAAQAGRISQLIQTLLADHQRIGILWRSLRQALSAVADGQASTLSSAELELFISAYRRHIEREEGELLPLAAQLLPTRDLEKIGMAMRLRRGIAKID